MAYLTLPNSVATATTVLADPLQENFQAIQTGLMCGAVDVNVNQFTGGALTVSGTVTATTLSYGGSLVGTRHLFLLQQQSGEGIGDEGDGYLQLWGWGNTAGDEKKYVMPHSGSVTGYGQRWEVTSQSTVGTLTLAIECSGTTLTSNEISLTSAACGGGNKTFYGAYTRGVHSFAAGAYVSIYSTEIQSGSAFGYLSTSLEVVFDE